MNACPVKLMKSTKEWIHPVHL